MCQLHPILWSTCFKVIQFGDILPWSFHYSNKQSTVTSKKILKYITTKSSSTNWAMIINLMALKEWNGI